MYQQSLGDFTWKSCIVEVVERGDDKYKSFKPCHSQQYTNDVIGKHLYEFMREDQDSVPDIFIALVNFFEYSPELLKTEGLFRVVACQD